MTHKKRLTKLPILRPLIFKGVNFYVAFELLVWKEVAKQLRYNTSNLEFISVTINLAIFP